MLMKPDSSLRSRPPEDGIIELSLLLSHWQFDALEQRARAEGVSVAQFLRQLVQDAVEDAPIGLPLGYPD